MKKRIIVCLLLISLLVSCFGIFAYAEDTEAATHDSVEYKNYLLGSYAFAPCGKAYHPIFDSYIDVDYFYSLDPRGLELDYRVVAASEYYDPSTSDGFLLIHFFNPYEIPIGDFRADPEGYGELGQGHVNGYESLVEKISPWNNTYFQTFIIRQTSEDGIYGYSPKIYPDGSRYYNIDFDNEFFDKPLELVFTGNDFNKICKGADLYATSVFDDLSRDPTFNFDNYPENKKDHSLQLIQLAESFTGDLYLYVYSPTKREGLPLIANSVRIGIEGESDGDVSYHDYNLIRLSDHGCITKYLVDYFKISSREERVYRIVSLSRLFLSEYDGVNTNHERYISFDVNQVWTVSEGDNTLSYTCQEMQSALITDKVLGYVPFLHTIDGATKFYQDSHFVAFNTDIPIDHLLGIKVSYKGTYYDEYRSGNFPPFSKEKIYSFSDEKWIYSDDSNQTTSSEYLFWKIGKDRVWDSIRSSSDFISNLGDSDYYIESGEDLLANTSWVVDYVNTDRNFTSYATVLDHLQYATINSMTILQLYYEVGGYTYNIGVIDNFNFEPPEQDVVIKPKPGSDVALDTSFIDALMAAVDKFLNEARAAFDGFKQVLGWSLLALAGMGVVILVVSFVKLFAPLKRLSYLLLVSDINEKNKKGTLSTFYYFLYFIIVIITMVAIIAVPMIPTIIPPKKEL